MPLNAQSGTTVTARRWIYFDGETLRLYADPTVYTDHVAQSIDVPEAVLEVAKAQALAAWSTGRPKPAPRLNGTTGGSRTSPPSP